MNDKEAIEICKKFTPVVYIEHPEMFGSRWQVEQDIKSIEAVKKVLNIIENQKAEIEKKDKIIDLMADSFAEEGFYSEHCQTLIDNDICPDDCNKCIKQYFEKKAEEEK